MIKAYEKFNRKRKNQLKLVTPFVRLSCQQTNESLMVSASLMMAEKIELRFIVFLNTNSPWWKYYGKLMEKLWLLYQELFEPLMRL